MAEAHPPQDNDAVNEEQDAALHPDGNNDARAADENHAEGGQLQDQDALIEQEPDIVHFEEDYLRYSSAAGSAIPGEKEEGCQDCDKGSQGTRKECTGRG